MKQGKRAVGQTVECGVVWLDYEVLCPECNEWAHEYGEVSHVDEDDDEHFLCTHCGDEVFPSEEA